MTLISQLTPNEVREATALLGKTDPQLDLIEGDVTLSDALAETIRVNALVPSKIEWWYIGDNNYGYKEYGDDCIVFSSPCTYNRDYSQEVDINETYEALIKIGGATPTSSLKQTASIIERFQAWQNDHWHFGGLEVTLYASSEAEPESYVEIASDSLWLVASDETAECVQEILDDLREQVTDTAEVEGYSRGIIDTLEMQEHKWSGYMGNGGYYQGYLENYPKRSYGNRVYGEDADPLDALPSFKGKQLGAFEFYWCYTDRGSRVTIEARCTHCDEEFRELSFATPAFAKSAKAELLDMSAHTYGCETWAESTWNQRKYDKKYSRGGA